MCVGIRGHNHVCSPRHKCRSLLMEHETFSPEEVDQKVYPSHPGHIVSTRMTAMNLTVV